MPASSPPLIPDSDEAREWAREELSRRVYSSTPSFWEWLKEKLLALLEALTPEGTGWETAFVPLIIVAIVAGIIVLAFIYAGPVRRRREGVRSGGGVWEEDDARSAAQLFAAARAAAADGHFSLAVVEQFRGLVRSLEERSLLETTQGMTALEISREIGARFPASAEAVRGAAHSFDEARYGSRPAGQAQFAALVALESELGAADGHRAGR